MKITLYARQSNMFAGMLANSLRQAKHQPLLLEKQKWAGRVEDCDAAIIHGTRNKALIEAYSHVPVFIIESGYLKRVNSRNEGQIGHWQLSYGDLNGMPGFYCPGDRFDALGLEIKKAQNQKGYVLLLGQMPGDSALNGTDHAAWLRGQIAYYENQGFTVKYRAHPKGGVELDGRPSLEGSLDEALGGAAFAVMYNSTAGFHCLLNGVGVVCDPCAPYYELSGEKCPPMAERRRFFNRMAYGQWTVGETAQAVDFMINTWLPKVK